MTTESQRLSQKGQLKMLNDQVKSLADGPEKMLKDLLEEAGQEGIATMIAPPVLQKLQLAIASMDAQRTSIELVVENKSGDVPNILKELNDAKKGSRRYCEGYESTTYCCQGIRTAGGPGSS